MLVFCEDCGAKHTIDEQAARDDTFQLRCDACDFLITAKSLPKPRKVVSKPKPEAPLKPVDPSMELTCSHESLEFGRVGEQEQVQTLILAAKDGRKVALAGRLDDKLKGNVNLSSVSGMAFRVEVVSPAHVAGACLAEYQGPGVVITDTISQFQKTVHLSFVRDVVI